MSRRKRNQMRRAMKRHNTKPITLAYRDVMSRYNRKLHSQTLQKLQKAQRDNELMLLLMRPINLGDVATLPLVNFIAKGN